MLFGNRFWASFFSHFSDFYRKWLQKWLPKCPADLQGSHFSRINNQSVSARLLFRNPLLDLGSFLGPFGSFGRHFVSLGRSFHHPLGKYSCLCHAFYSFFKFSSSPLPRVSASFLLSSVSFPPPVSQGVGGRSASTIRQHRLVSGSVKLALS